MHVSKASPLGDLPCMGNIFCNAGQTLPGGESLVKFLSSFCVACSAVKCGEVEVEMAWIYLGKKQRVDHSLKPLALWLKPLLKSDILNPYFHSE